jgi:hypothetical protein
MSIAEATPLRSTIPARLDRLRWSPFHTPMAAGLGAAWILDGLQITISSSVTGVLQSPKTLGMTSSEIGLIAQPARHPFHQVQVASGAERPVAYSLKNRRPVTCDGMILTSTGREPGAHGSRIRRNKVATSAGSSTWSA